MAQAVTSWKGHIGLAGNPQSPRLLNLPLQPVGGGKTQAPGTQARSPHLDTQSTVTFRNLGSQKKMYMI